MSGLFEVGKKGPLLTRAQRRGVEYADGPLIVLAGPGTGKTRVIVERIAHAIRERGVDPARILAITFTIKAAEEMRRRLAMVLGDNRADQVRTCTSHSFGREVVARFGDVLGFAETPRLIDGPVTRRTLRELSRKLGSFSDLPAQGRDGAVAESVKIIGACRNADVSAKRAVAFAEEWGRTIEARREPGSEEDDDFLADVARQRRFADQAALYAAFETECHRRGWITMDELISLPIRLMREHPMVAAILRQEAKVVLFDEFQDANLAQIELLRLLCPPKSSPDLCVVGDDDQAIYRFRGADDRGFERFKKIWGKVELVRLDENHRSHDPIVRLAGLVMSHAEYRFDKNKTLKVAESKPEHLKGLPIEVVRLGTSEWARDAEMISSLILEERRRAEAAGIEPVPLSKIAVIARSKADGARIHGALELERIPSKLLVKTKLLDDPGVQDVMEWITLLTMPGAWWAVSHALCRPPVGLSGGAAVEIRRRFEESVARTELERDGAGAMLEQVRPYVAWLREQGAKVEGAGPAVERFVRLYDRLSQVAAGVPADRALLEVIAAIGTPDAELLPARERAARVRSLAGFMAYAQSRLAMLESPGDLGALREYLADLDDSDDGVSPDEQVSGDGDGSGGDDEEMVQVLTAHKSKGLEFDTVYVPRIGQYGYVAEGKDDELQLPVGLVEEHGLEALSSRVRADAEARRVFYVACTRAERRLVLIAPTAKDIKKSSTATFVREIREAMPGTLKDRVIERLPDEVIASARDAGVSLAVAGGVEAELADLPRREARRVILDQARRAARNLASKALEQADHPRLTDAVRGQIARMMADSARMLQIAAALESGAELPAWEGQESAHVKLFGERLAELVRTAPLDSDFESLLIRAPKPPLSLSQSSIAEYQRCPRCYYLKYVIGFPEPQTLEVGLGQVAHKALEQFYRAWREADAQGEATPGREELLRIGRACFERSAVQGIVADRRVLDDLTVLLSRVFDTLHDPAAHILDLEKYVKFAYVHAGQTHYVSGKIDRVDQRADGGYRIIDYKSGGIDPKTGAAIKKYAEPKEDDLQMGLYAMALPHLYGGADTQTLLPGEAEYWVLGAGVRGTIDFGALKLEKIRKLIGTTIDGILAGRFAPDPKCGGLCGRLGLGLGGEA